MIANLQIFQLSDILQNPTLTSSQPLVCLKQNQIRISISDMNKQKAYDMQNILQQSNRSRRAQKNSTSSKRNWRVDQLQFIFYVLDKYCFLYRKALQQLIEQDWETLKKIFPGRQTFQCKYKILSLRKYSLQEHPWNQQEESIFQKIISQQGLKWDIVSKKLHQKGKSKVFRNSKQCRQHYLCFVNPHMKKGVWNNDEDYLLLSLYLRYGRKWAKMSKTIKGRNQNAIKNRFFLLVQNKCKNKSSQQQKKINVNIAKQYKEEAEKIKQAYQEKLGQQKIALLQSLILQQQILFVQDSYRRLEDQQKKQPIVEQKAQNQFKFQSQKDIKLNHASSIFDDHNSQMLNNNGEHQYTSFLKSEQFLNFLAF